jgi:hypothetical protein
MAKIDIRVKKIKAYCNGMASRYIATMRILAMVKPLVYDEKFVKRYHNSVGGHGLGVLREALMLGYVDDLFALTQDTDDRSASLVNIVKLLGDSALRDVVKVEFCTLPPCMWVGIDDEATEKRLTEQEAKAHTAKQAPRFDKIWESVVKGTDDIVASEIGRKINKVRNKLSSHYEMTAQGKEPRLMEIGDFALKWGDPERYMEDAKPIIFDTVLLVTNTDYHLQSFELSAAQIAEAFWNTDTEST